MLSYFWAVKKKIIILFLLSISLFSFAGNSDKDKTTTKTVAGKITDSFGESIAGAAILIAETGETYFSDLDGNFKISLKTEQEYSISIQTIGYQPLQLKSTGLTLFSDLSLKSL